MAFNVFSDSSKLKAPTVFGFGGTNVNSTPKLKIHGAPGSTPAKIFGQKSKGLSIRSSSDLNILSPSPRLLGVKKDNALAGKCTLKPFEILGKSTSPNKQRSPSKQKSPQRQFKTLSPVFAVKTNQEIESIEKPEEFVFRKPSTPRKNKKLDMEYPEPENLAPICDIEYEMFDLTSNNFLKSCNNTYFFPDEDEGFLSDNEVIPFVQEEITITESVLPDMEVALPDLETISLSETS